MQQDKVNSKLKLSSSSVFINVFFENDIADDRDFYKFSQETKGKIFTVGTSNKFSFLQKLNRRFYFVRLIRRFHLTILKSLEKDRNVGFKKINNHKFSIHDECMYSEKDLYITKKFIKRIGDFSFSKGSSFFLTAIPYDSKRAIVTNYGCYKTIAKEQNIPFIDAPNGFFEDPNSYFFEIDIHLNKKGNELLAAKIIDFLQINTELID